MEDLRNSGEIAAQISEFVIKEATRMQKLPERQRHVNRKAIKHFFEQANEPLHKDMTKQAADYIWLTHLRRLHEQLANESSHVTKLILPD